MTNCPVVLVYPHLPDTLTGNRIGFGSSEGGPALALAGLVDVSGLVDVLFCEHPISPRHTTAAIVIIFHIGKFHMCSTSFYEEQGKSSRDLSRIPAAGVNSSAFQPARNRTTRVCDKNAGSRLYFSFICCHSVQPPVVSA